MKLPYPYILLIFLLSNSLFSQEDSLKGREISFFAEDGLEITADLYQTNDTDAPWIILYHQANFSRGSYRTIAPRLNDLGYNCIAIDQRSGHKARKVINKTCKRAIKEDKRIKFIHAIPDMEASLLYVKNELKAKETIVWGSSYSASLVFYLGAKYKEDISAILSFSPGEYLEIESREIKSYAAEIHCPAFISSAKNERKKWDAIYESIPGQKAFYLPEVSGEHGSKALWPDKKGNEAYWEAVIGFLKSLH